MPEFHVTYEIVTPESAEHCDAAERGFVLPGDEREELPKGTSGAPAGEIKAACGMRLREALELIGLVDDGGDGTDYYECDARQDYRTGAETRYALHVPDNVTAASIGRIARVLKSRRLLLD